MRNFKDIIIEKLKVTKNYGEFTWDEFINALYKYDDHHDLWFEDLPNINGYDDLPEFEYDGKTVKLSALVMFDLNFENNTIDVLYYPDNVSEHIILVIHNLDELTSILGDELSFQIYKIIS